MLYVANKRAKFNGISGPVNIPYGGTVELINGYLYKDGKKICSERSHKSHEFFSADYDGNWEQRGKLVKSIKDTLENRDEQYQVRWDKIWADSVCKKFKRVEHEDFWVWNDDFYRAQLPDLWHIARLIGAKI